MPTLIRVLGAAAATGAAAIGIVAIAACATSSGTVTLKGSSTGECVDVRAVAADSQREARIVTFAVEIHNHSPDAVVVDVDAIVLRRSDGIARRVLGQRAGGPTRGSDEKSATDEPPERTPYGKLTLAPRQKRELPLEFKATTAGSWVLIVPRIDQLGIEGQVHLPAVRVPLEALASSTAGTGDAAVAAFYDPFVE